MVDNLQVASKYLQEYLAGVHGDMTLVAAAQYFLGEGIKTQQRGEGIDAGVFEEKVAEIENDETFRRRADAFKIRTLRAGIKEAVELCSRVIEGKTSPTGLAQWVRNRLEITVEESDEPVSADRS